MMLPRPLPLFLLIAVAGCGTAEQATNTPSPPEEIAAPTAPDASGRDPQAPDTYQVRLATTEGEVVVDVDRSLAPRGADRFHRLVKEGYFDGAKFFRVVEGFVVQFGMAADPAVNAKWDNSPIPDDPVRESNQRGTVTFATSGPDSRTTQIFINLGNNSSLDPQGFSPFGRVTQGMEVVEKFYAGYGEAPQQPLIGSRGNAYLDAEFPELDAIETAEIVSENGQPVTVENTETAEPAAE